jgi:hypothetical protein
MKCGSSVVWVWVRVSRTIDRNIYSVTAGRWMVAGMATTSLRRGILAT